MSWKRETAANSRYVQSDSNFKDIYNTYSDMVYNLCLNYMQNAQDAEELTQDVFVKIHHQLYRFKHQSGLKTWIYRITINHCLDFLKAKKRQKRFGFHIPLFTDTVYPAIAISGFDHPGVRLEDKEAVARIFFFINQLPPKQKTALILKVIEDLPHREIAQIMKLSAKAVESLLSRAKANLKKNMQASEGL